MMSSLFYIFDPSLSVISVWFMFFLFLLYLPSFFWSTSVIYNFFFFMVIYFSKEVSCSLSSPFKGAYSFIISVFFVVFFMNFFSMFPYIFPLTSHLCVTFPLSFMLWFTIIFFILLNFFYHFLSHLIPVGTPSWLISFMVMVEFISNLIRPLSLTFRLTANMMAGHLLMSLFSAFIMNLNSLLFFCGGVFQLVLVFMEMGVSLIQSYVFSTLLLLYISEIK